MIQPLTARFIVVNKSNYEVTFWKLRLKSYRSVRKYKIAIGARGYETPTGLYFVQAKAKKPSWLAPYSDWVPQGMRGKVIPYGDPLNPFDGPFIAFDQKRGYGLHGTKASTSIGTAASHGCIRMKPEDALDLFHRAPVGCPVFIH